MTRHSKQDMIVMLRCTKPR